MVPINTCLTDRMKQAISMHCGSLENLLIQDHHLIKKTKSCTLPNLTVMKSTRYKL